MASISGYRSKSSGYREQREIVAKARATRQVEEFAKSEQVQLFAQISGGGANVLGKIVDIAVSEAFNPITIFEDTLRSQGYRQAQLNKQVFKIYTDIMHMDDTGKDYEDIIKEVAEYVYDHQYLYETFDPNKL